MSLFSSASALYGVGGFVVAWRFYRWYRERKANPNGLPLPPGPKGRPFIDNLLDFPTYKAWLVYDEWTKLYGDIVYFKVLGQPFLLLGSSVTTSNIFEKRSSNYSDRARMPMLCELMGWDWSFALMPYGPRWKHYRRIFHEHFQQNVVHKYNNIHVDATRAFLQRLLEAPEDFIQHTRHLFAATILKITYGIDIQEKDDPFVNAAEVINRSLAEAGNPGSFLVDLFPAMKHIPDWFPGAQWKKKQLTGSA
ncbi:hypothetical protein D9756_003621 [Leucocoprinus leucothites]|uniref:Cytochrome P450 n=1 Tax=Leucocoprinus leucothites TaxID=201217 RepID=A0A8H5LJ88_9AGAR|nr:hypothetical protein D9756_003621 [Leucoagaricus leucothites]